MNEPAQPQNQNRKKSFPRSLNWRWVAAVLLYGSAIAGLLSGVDFSERPELDDLLTKAYYSLGLFVVGGLDLGTPTGGSAFGRALLWIAYFGCPLLMASAVIEAVLRVMRPGRWQLRRLSDHVIIVGSGELTTSYLRMLRGHMGQTQIVVVDETVEPVRAEELEQTFGVTVVTGNITHRFLQRELRLKKAVQLVFLGNNDFQAYEAASKVLSEYPALGSRIVLHCHNLRFMRSMQDTSVARLCTTFNSYHLAAQSFVRDALLSQFHRTAQRDVVVLAGFGRFGQTIMEELEASAREIERMFVIDIDADRRMLVAEEQQRLKGTYERIVLQGDISHPEVWRRLTEQEDLSRAHPTILLGTGRAEDNLRTALWIKRKYPNALVFARTNDKSQLAEEVGSEHGIETFSIKQLTEDNIPPAWLPTSYRA
ncbi:MAG: potassium transporter TrkA [Gammaproteobacteria bacterium]|jgi:Trk K+ transport system NAD-binding subunit|nr:MAG: potassium transporter TrkA [Gammaproteobacteria bacterium]